MESAEHRHERGCVRGAQIRVTAGRRGIWFVQPGVGGVETLTRVAESAGQPLAPALNLLPPKSLSRCHGPEVEVGVPVGALIC